MGGERGYSENDWLNRPVMAINKTQMDGGGGIYGEETEERRTGAGA